MKPIDADALREKFADVLNSTYTDDYAKVFVAGLYAAMNMPTITPPNEPLTLEQLRKMDDEPVYVVIDDGNEPLKMWALVDYIKEEQCLTLTNNLGGRSEYYTADDLKIDHITAYRHPPEGEGST